MRDLIGYPGNTVVQSKKKKQTKKTKQNLPSSATLLENFAYNI